MSPVWQVVGPTSVVHRDPEMQVTVSQRAVQPLCLSNRLNLHVLLLYGWGNVSLLRMKMLAEQCFHDND